MKTSGMLLCSLFAIAATASPLPQWSWGGSSSGISSNTANDVTNNTPCKGVTIIFARGTGERGNIGSVIGPPLLKALQSKLPNNVAFQGVPYPADNSGNYNNGGTGGPLMTSLAQQALKQCPNTKLVLSGYSQGGIVVHAAADSLKATPPAGAVVFGDPYKGRPVGNLPASKVKQFCGSSDSICSRGGTTGSGSHISYGNNAPEAANFVAGLL